MGLEEAGGLGIVDDQTAEVATVGGGKVTFCLGDGRMLDLRPGDPRLRHIDHARASTVHAYQGRTVDTVIAAMEANHPSLTTQKTPYVEISRACESLEGRPGRGPEALPAWRRFCIPGAGKVTGAGVGTDPRAEERGPRTRAVVRLCICCYDEATAVADRANERRAWPVLNGSFA